MKTLVPILAALLVAPVKAEEPPKMTFAVGMCTGVVLGLATGIVIVVGIRCWQRPPPLVQNTNAPAWTTLPPAGTNSPPPGTNAATATIDAGNAVEHVDLSPLNMGMKEGMRFMLEASDDNQTWAPLYTVKVWFSEDGETQFAAAYDANERLLATTLSREKINCLPVPLGDRSQRFFRVKHP